MKYNIEDGRWHVWKHDCIQHGQGDGPCNPPCKDPWQADAPWPAGGRVSGTFATWTEAMAHIEWEET